LVTRLRLIYHVVVSRLPHVYGYVVTFPVVILTLHTTFTFGYVCCPVVVVDLRSRCCARLRLVTLRLPLLVTRLDLVVAVTFPLLVGYVYVAFGYAFVVVVDLRLPTFVVAFGSRFTPLRCCSRLRYTVVVRCTLRYTRCLVV